MSTSRAWNLMRVSSGGLWWGLYPRVAGGARHGWCQGREWRLGQAWGNPPGQLWHGETWRDWEAHFSASLYDSSQPKLCNASLLAASLCSDECKMAACYFASRSCCMAWLEELSVWCDTVVAPRLHTFLFSVFQCLEKLQATQPAVSSRQRLRFWACPYVDDINTLPGVSVFCLP